MKKLYSFITIISIFLISINSYANTTLTVGASAVPHGEILEQAKPILAKKGIDLKIIIFQDYVLPNRALASKDLDANFFQHIVYLNNQNKQFNYNFVNAGGVHIEPIGIYSSKYKNIDDIKKAKSSTVILSNSVADRGRVLSLLESAGLITLKDGIDKVNASFNDIISNPYKLKFSREVDPSLLARAYQNNEANLVIINTNYALQAGLSPASDALIIEGSNSPYVNIIAVRSGDENTPKIKELVKALHSPEVIKFINTKYNGAIIPVK